MVNGEGAFRFLVTKGLFGVGGEVCRLWPGAPIVRSVIELKDCLFGVDLGVAISLSRLYALLGFDFGVDSKSPVVASSTRALSLPGVILGVPKAPCTTPARGLDIESFEIGERGV